MTRLKTWKGSGGKEAWWRDRGNEAMTDGGSPLAMMMGVSGDDPLQGQRAFSQRRHSAECSMLLEEKATVTVSRYAIPVGRVDWPSHAAGKMPTSLGDLPVENSTKVLYCVLCTFPRMLFCR